MAGSPNPLSMHSRIVMAAHQPAMARDQAMLRLVPVEYAPAVARARLRPGPGDDHVAGVGCEDGVFRACLFLVRPVSSRLSLLWGGRSGCRCRRAVPCHALASCPRSSSHCLRRAPPTPPGAPRRRPRPPPPSGARPGSHLYVAAGGQNAGERSCVQVDPAHVRLVDPVVDGVFFRDLPCRPVSRRRGPVARRRAGAPPRLRPAARLALVQGGLAVRIISLPETPHTKSNCQAWRRSDRAAAAVVDDYVVGERPAVTGRLLLRVGPGCRRGRRASRPRMRGAWPWTSCPRPLPALGHSVRHGSILVHARDSKG